MGFLRPNVNSNSSIQRTWILKDIHKLKISQNHKQNYLPLDWFHELRNDTLISNFKRIRSWERIGIIFADSKDC